MISYKGGVGKSTTAIHLSGCLAKRGNTLLIDGDQNRSALEWGERGPGLPFIVVDEKQAFRAGNDYAHIVIDTAARPSERQLKAIIESSDKLVLCTAPDAVSMSALNPAITDLQSMGANFAILITLCPPLSKQGSTVRDIYRSQNLQVYTSIIRRFSAYQAAALNGLLVRDVKDQHASDAWGDYQALAREIK